MQATHTILQWPWKFDKDVSMNGHASKYSFIHGDKKITFVPLSPQQVAKDQEKLLKENEQHIEKKMKAKFEIHEAPKKILLVKIKMEIEGLIWSLNN